ncbi:hypothetical protein RN607_11720 [Demequina capsici]|uniref:Leucine rich repeat variant n=1 Tax=Demequina capsici TaxID=3075620 RepID=A0AA96F556_9MICO|nr:MULTISPECIES: hypothetical protein [unclassified Demequina]WNM24033.1 hypothetical protein RN606_11785 [Demequina sp. OYTSA14]WNM26860.1 hypothetical protein RN607_11720 [Demequina sp. PMTSA13]
MADDERSWARALMVSSGVALDHRDRAAGPSHEWLEAGAADLARARLLQFASHPDPRIRETIALRPDCPVGVLATLAFDGDRTVRRGVASSPRIPQAVSTELAGDRDQAVLKALLRNPATDEATVRALAGHRRAEIREIARAAIERRAAALPTSRDAAADPDEHIPMELRDRWRPPQAEVSPATPQAARTYAPRPVVPARAVIRASQA